MSEKIDQLKSYAEACNTLRHYSNASLTVRITSIVQGIALLIAWAYVLTRSESQYKYAVIIPIAGFLFTILLYRFHMGYFRATEVFYRVTAKIEEKFFDEDCRPHSMYQSLHKEMYNNFWGCFFTINVPFTLVGSLFCIALAISTFSLLG